MRADEIGRKVTVGLFQLQEVGRLLLDVLVVDERDGYGAKVTRSKALDIRREASQVVTRPLKEMTSANIQEKKKLVKKIIIHI